jgi:transmembrane sensor
MAAGLAVVALGTRFQVRQDGAESVVTLIEGSVRIVRANGSTRVLKPGERATLDRLGGIIISRVDAEEAVSWSRGWLVFRNEPLSRVVAEVNRYADQPIRLAEPSLGSLRLSGNFRVGDSASMASAMAALLPLAVADAGDGLELRLAGSGG